MPTTGNYVPSYDDMVNVAKEIGKLAREINLLDVEIKKVSADAVTKALTIQEGQKPPSMELLKATVQFTGSDGSLINKRNELAIKEGTLEEYKLIFQAMRDAITLFVTESANQRQSLGA